MEKRMKNLAMAYAMARKAKMGQPKERLTERHSMKEFYAEPEDKEEVEGFADGGMVDDESLQYPAPEEQSEYEPEGPALDPASEEPNEDEDRLKFLRTYLTRKKLRR